MRRHKVHWYESNSWWYAEVKGRLQKNLIGEIFFENGYVVLYHDNPRQKIVLGKIENDSGIAKKLTTHIAKTMLEKNE
jgi:hypothetical protein